MHQLQRSLKYVLVSIFALGAFLFVPDAENRHVPAFERIIKRGVLRVASFDGPGANFGRSQELSGFEYVLAKRFAEKLDLNLEIINYSNQEEIYQAVKNGDADFAAANLVPHNRHYGTLRISVPYRFNEPKLIYRRELARPKSLSDIENQLIYVAANSFQEDKFDAYQLKHPALDWRKVDSIDVNQILKLMAAKNIDYAVVNANDYALLRSLYPQIKIAFSLDKPQPVRWVFPKQGDDSLYLSAHHFLKAAKKSGVIEEINRDLYQHIASFNYSGARIFQRHIKQRLPDYKAKFKEAARRHKLDWHLLAAVSYQESAWNSKAISPTGVRGLMMLTRITASEVGVLNRTDPNQSIEGGAIYLKKIINRFPELIGNQEQVWFGLAAYNAGYGHVSDARAITEKQGGNPNNWLDVKERLPLLQQPRWYKESRFGYSKSAGDAQKYVKNIRRYYDLLLWSDLDNDTQQVISSLDTKLDTTSI